MMPSKQIGRRILDFKLKYVKYVAHCDSLNQFHVTLLLLTFSYLINQLWHIFIKSLNIPTAYIFLSHTYIHTYIHTTSI